MIFIEKIFPMQNALEKFVQNLLKKPHIMEYNRIESLKIVHSKLN